MNATKDGTKDGIIRGDKNIIQHVLTNVNKTFSLITRLELITLKT